MISPQLEEHQLPSHRVAYSVLWFLMVTPCFTESLIKLEQQV